jgi:hypothetical protein
MVSHRIQHRLVNGSGAQSGRDRYTRRRRNQLHPTPLTQPPAAHGASSEVVSAAHALGHPSVRAAQSTATTRPFQTPPTQPDDELDALFRTLSAITRAAIAGGDIPAATPMVLRRDDLDGDRAHLL